ncbi:MAG: alpha/beta hydrolase [Clostridiaceae bacterium]|jgi:predicted alpha/beta hydrolase family esterase|nr:alpha/beta hydrolase [Clostridiaceae bacterium]
MNEASSKFVDNLAMDKLLKEKLKKVNHSPKHSMFVPAEGLFSNINNILNVARVNYYSDNSNHRCIEIPSFEITTHYSENNTIHIYNYPSVNAERNLLFVHGLFDDNILNYEYLFKLLNGLNINVYFMTMPYHFNRKPKSSLFSGEFFLSADIFRTQSAFKQAVLDIDASLQFIRNENSFPNILAGFSMGGCVALRHYLLSKQEIPTFLINPVTDFCEVLWDSPLFVTIGKDLINSGYDVEKCKKFFVEMDPSNFLDDSFKSEKIAMVYSKYDQVINEKKYKKFINKTGIRNTYAYHSGHLNVLRVPKLAKDITEFIEKVI